MKRLIIFTLLLVYSLIFLKIYSQPSYRQQSSRIGYDYFIPIDMLSATMTPDNEPKVNTIPGKSGGTGAQTDPYIVATAEDLFEIANRVNNGTENASTVFPNGNQGYNGQYFLMTNNLDISSYDPWPCIGIPGQKIFYGNFDGGNHIIRGLILNAGSSSNQGLFSVIGNNAVVHGITIQNGQLNGSYYTGAIAGAAGEFSTIYDCHNYSNVSSNGYYTGGIAGASWGTIYNCTNAGNNSGADFCGGIVGDFYGTIYNCANIGNISGSSSIGGIVGYSDQMSATNLINAGKITGTSGYNGGVIGFVANYNTNKTTSCCLNFGDVICSSSSSAAVIGRLWTEGGVPSTADHCYYDKQLTLKLGVYPGGDITDVAEGKFTHEMIGNGLSANLNPNFIFASGLYPCPTGTEESIIADVAIAPASLKFSDINNFDRYNSVNNHFTVSISNETNWSSSDESKMKIFDDEALLLNTGNATLSCSKGSATKTIGLTITNAPPFDCYDPVLLSVIQDFCDNKPCLLVNFSKANYVIGGYNIIVDDQPLMNVPNVQEISLSDDNIIPNVEHCFKITSECVSGEIKTSNEICATLITTGIEAMNNDIMVYPNPSSSYIIVDGNNIQSICIIDNVGRTVKQLLSDGSNINTINTSDLYSGLFFIVIKTIDNNIIVKKFVNQ